jgi:hypothetical protein
MFWKAMSMKEQHMYAIQVQEERCRVGERQRRCTSSMHTVYDVLEAARSVSAATSMRHKGVNQAAVEPSSVNCGVQRQLPAACL